MAALDRFRGAVHQVQKRITEKKVSSQESLIEKAVKNMQTKKQAKVAQSSRKGALDEYVALLDSLAQSLDDSLQGKDALSAATKAMERLQAWDSTDLRAEPGYAAATAQRVALVARISAVGSRCPAWKNPSVEKQLARLQADTTNESEAVGTAQKAEQDAQLRAYEDKVKGLTAIERARLNLDVKTQIKQNTEEMCDALKKLNSLLAELEQGLQGDCKGSAAMSAAVKALDRLEAWDAGEDKTLRSQSWYPTEQRQKLVEKIDAVGSRCPAWSYKGNGHAERVQKLAAAA